MKFINVLKECRAQKLEEATLIQLIRTMENNPELNISSIPPGIIQISMSDKRPAKVEDVDKLVNSSYIPNEKKAFVSRALRNLISARNSTNLDKAVNDFKSVYNKNPQPSMGR